MDESDCDGQTRYRYLREKLKAFVPAAASSADGGKVYGVFFNAGIHTEVLITGSDVDTQMNKYGPGGGTATHLAVEAAFKIHQADPKTPTLLFLVTDGRPDSTDAVNREIVSVTKRLDNPESFRIMVLTVGQRTPELTAWLEQLDAELGPMGAKFDIVGQNNLNDVDFQEAAAELIASTTTNAQAAAGDTAGKATHRID